MSVRVVAATQQGAGQGFDLTDQVEGLNWSSVNPGGDETCTFTLKRSWFAESPELRRGNLLRVMDGVDVLWQGRIEEADRAGDSTEAIGVTAYGLGARLKDATMKEIYIDQDFSHWGSIPNDRIVQLGAAWQTDAGSSEVRPSAAGSPVLSLIYTRLANSATVKGLIEVWYDANGIELGSVLYERKSAANGSSFVEGISFFADQNGSGEEGAVINGAGVIPAAPVHPFAVSTFYYNATFAGDGEWRLDLTLAVYGRHGLALQGSGAGGFTVSQLVANMASRAPGITVRRVDGTAFVVEQSVYLTPTKIEDAISDANRYEANRRTYGTWGPDSPLDNSLNGYFDYRAIDTEPSWIVQREDCDSCDLHSETATLYNRAEVSYTDKGGTARTVVVTAEVPELNGIPRTTSFDGGTLTKAGAEALGQAVLALSGGFAPARGSVVLSRPIRHLRRGMLPPHYARADGSAFQVLGILPASSVFALDATPNRRTTFPIKRVAVDASSKASPVATIELDQTNDAISALQARLAEQAEVPHAVAA